ncbi:hypothetical protein ACFQ0T_15375 [Kitasatospora gansuensis]
MAWVRQYGTEPSPRRPGYRFPGSAGEPVLRSIAALNRWCSASEAGSPVALGVRAAQRPRAWRAVPPRQE